jgi:DHA2 family multidrug resistance protein
MVICAMTATIMRALDTTIANVALPYMQGAVGIAGPDQLGLRPPTSLAAAIAAAPWVDRQPIRPKRIFIICSAASPLLP